MSSERRVAARTRLGRRLTAVSLTAGRAVGIISLFTLSLTLVAALMAHLLDPDDFPNIGISAWWALQTVTTVGYGDFVPHNAEGRIIGSVVMLGGISFAAVVTAAIAAALVEAARQRRGAQRPGNEEEHPLAPQLEEIAARLERLETRLGSDPRGRDEP